MPGARSSRPSACTEVLSLQYDLAGLCDLGHSGNGRSNVATRLARDIRAECVIQGTARTLELDDTAPTRDPSAREHVPCSTHPQCPVRRCRPKDSRPSARTVLPKIGRAHV